MTDLTPERLDDLERQTRATRTKSPGSWWRVRLYEHDFIALIAMARRTLTAERERDALRAEWTTITEHPAKPDSNFDVRDSAPAVRSVDLRHRVFDEVSCERDRQESLKAIGKFRYTCADPEMIDADRSLVLLEEVGEVARAVLESDAANVHQELVQVAAVAVAWLESHERAIAGNYPRAALAHPTAEVES